jgi:glycosyltransferase involved in cell wall biosynthesis
VNFRAVIQEEFATTSSWDSLGEIEVFVVPSRVDVVVCTYNSELFLERCLLSVYTNIPVRKLWVIDNFSVDKTVEIAEKFNAQVVKTRLSLAESRRLSFRLVETSVFVNIDSDVVLCKDWFRRCMKYWCNDVGCVCGITVDQHPLQKAYLESMWKLRRAESYDIAHLPNMIARKDALVDVEFPEAILGGSVANEDYSIRDWIRKKGFRVVNAPVFVKHYTFPPLLDRKTFWYGASGRVSKYVSLKSLLLRCVFAFPQSVYAAFCSRNARVIPYWLKFRFQVLYGFLNYRRFYKMERKTC